MLGTIIHCIQKATTLHISFLHTLGVLTLHNPGMVTLDDHYGIDSVHFTVDVEDEVLSTYSSRINIHLNQQQIASLLYIHTINPLATSENYNYALKI